MVMPNTSVLTFGIDSSAQRPNSSPSFHPDRSPSVVWSDRSRTSGTVDLDLDDKWWELARPGSTATIWQDGRRLVLVVVRRRCNARRGHIRLWLESQQATGGE